MQSLDVFYEESVQYIERFNAFIEKHALVGRAKPDHICYKCGSRESFENMRALFEETSEYIYQSIISKRRIAIIRFTRVIETSIGPIYFMELSDQKPDNSQHDGFDHIEVYPIGWSYDDMVHQFEKSEHVIKAERPHHTTHDIDIGDGFLFRCTQELLVDKIKREEMV